MKGCKRKNPNKYKNKRSYEDINVVGPRRRMQKKKKGAETKV